MTKNLDVMRQAQQTYRPLLEELYNTHFNARLSFMYTQPNSQAFCNLSEEEIANCSLATLAGKKTRVHATAYADYVESWGGVPVTMAFGDVVPALERGVINCAITSLNVAYSFKFGQVSNTMVDLPVKFSTHVFVMNNDSWNNLNAETQAFLTEQFAKLEADMLGHTAYTIEESANCLHDGPCPLGEPAHMSLVTLSPEDEAKIKRLVEEFVLARWATRCGEGCADKWNAALSDIVGLTMVAGQ